jgi:hypothetical protein
MSQTVFARFLEGKVRLVICFWLFYIVGIGVLYFFTVASLMAMAALPGGGGPDALTMFIILLNATYAYAFFITVFTWRSSNNYQGRKLWPRLSKVFMGIFGIYLSMVVAAYNIEGFADLVFPYLWF